MCEIAINNNQEAYLLILSDVNRTALDGSQGRYSALRCHQTSVIIKASRHEL